MTETIDTGAERQLVASDSKSTVLPVFSLTPSTMEEALKLATLIAESDLAPKDFRGKPGNVLIAVQMGQEIGLKPMQAIQNIAVINGRPCLWGDALLALVQNSGLLVDCSEQFDEKTQTATCGLKRKGQATPIIRSFSMADAKKANLSGKAGTWQNYPIRMLQMRARAFALRDGFADVLKGFNMAEEARDIQPIDVTPVDIPQMPTRASETPKEVDVPFNAPEQPKEEPNKPEQPQGDWKSMKAKFNGYCKKCNGPIDQGDEIIYNAGERELRHPECADSA